MEATMAFAVPDVSALRDWCDSTTLSLYPEKAPGKSFPMVSIMAWKATTWSLPSRPLRHQRHAKHAADTACADIRYEVGQVTHTASPMGIGQGSGLFMSYALKEKPMSGLCKR